MPTMPRLPVPFEQARAGSTPATWGGLLQVSGLSTEAPRLCASRLSSSDAIPPCSMQWTAGMDCAPSCGLQCCMLQHSVQAYPALPVLTALLLSLPPCSLPHRPSQQRAGPPLELAFLLHPQAT